MAQASLFNPVRWGYRDQRSPGSYGSRPTGASLFQNLLNLLLLSWANGFEWSGSSTCFASTGFASITWT